MVPSFAYRPAVTALAGFAAFALGACGSSNNPASADAALPQVDASPDASDLVMFSYTPSWTGVVSVEVIGAFGQAGDWTTPLVTLTAAGGTFTGGAQVAAGQYPYLFHIIGDDAAGPQSATLSRYAFDPASAAFVACPPESPTYSAANANPCSVTQASPAAQSHVRGGVVKDGAPIAGFLVVLEREETGSHHFFVDRATTGSDGAYDFIAAPGSYRVQIQHPQFESRNDAQLASESLAIVRRSLSSPFTVAADVTLSSTEIAFHNYAAFTPRTTATLPTTFAFGASTVPTRLEVYGTRMQGMGSEIGDPWFSSPPTLTGGAAFDGTFNTQQAGETAAAPLERYFWGIEQKTAADGGGVSWTAQSLVFPITWQ